MSASACTRSVSGYPLVKDSTHVLRDIAQYVRVPYIKYAYHTRTFQSSDGTRSRVPFVLMKYRQFAGTTTYAVISQRSQWAYAAFIQQ